MLAGADSSNCSVMVGYAWMCLKFDCFHSSSNATAIFHVCDSGLMLAATGMSTFVVS